MSASAPILVTGATGFFGGNLARELARSGERVRVLVRGGCRPIALDGLACEVVEGALNKLGVSGFRAMAKREIGLTLGPMETMLLVKAVEGEFVRSFSTCLKHGAPEKEGGGETVFTGPAMKPAPTMGLAGG